MGTNKTAIRLGGMAVVLLALAGCTTQGGEEGNLYFKYEHPGVWAFGIDVAVGTRVDVGVYSDEEATEPVNVVEAMFDPASGAFTVAEREGNILTIEAVQPGSADLVVNIGESSDRVEMTAQSVDTLEWHVPDPFQVSGEEGDFAAGGTALVPYDLKHDGNLLIGYGVDGLDTDPIATATIADQVPFADVYFVHVDFEAAGAVSLLHADATALPVTAVAPTAITAATWNDFGGSTVALDGVATPLFLDAQQTGGRLVFGLLGLATVESTTPTTCSVAPSTLWGDGVYEVSGTAEGSCTVRATINGLTADWTGDVTATDG